MSEAYDLQPRFVRASAAPRYCGMCERIFNAEIRPYLTEISIGVKGVAFDRLDLDAALDDYKERYGRAPKRSTKEHGTCRRKEKLHAVSSSGTASGSSTNRSTVADLREALGQPTGRKRKGT